MDEEAREAGAYHWAEIAKRYRDIPNDKLSFNVVNEPGREIASRQYRDTNDKVLKAVRAISPDRLFILDALQNVKPPVDAIRNFENCGYSMHFYEPTALTHYGVAGRNELVTWPTEKTLDKWGDRNVSNKAEMEQIVALWAAVSQCFGVGVHCGEFGTYFQIPHATACA